MSRWAGGVVAGAALTVATVVGGRRSLPYAPDARADGVGQSRDGRMHERMMQNGGARQAHESMMQDAGMAEMHESMMGISASPGS